MPVKIKDISKQRFGKLFAIAPTNKRSHRSVVWKCRCSCGKIKFVSSHQLQGGMTKSCGCLHKKNITGKKYGRLLALEPTKERSTYREVIWKCLCDCGNVAFIVEAQLSRRITKSCGCLADASRYVKGTNIDPMDIPFEITDCMKARRDLNKVIKQAS